jgi:hypothetical protein
MEKIYGIKKKYKIIKNRKIYRLERFWMDLIVRLIHNQQ